MPNFELVMGLYLKWIGLKIPGRKESGKILPSSQRYD